MHHPFALDEVIDNLMPFGFECVPLVDMLDRKLSLDHIDLRFELLFVLGIIVFDEVPVEKLDIPYFMYFAGQLDVLFYVINGPSVNFKIFPNLAKIHVFHIWFAPLGILLVF